MKNYNYLALQGWEVDDAEVCHEWKLDKSFIGNPEINNAYLDALYKRTLEGYLQTGMAEDVASQKAYAIYIENKCMIDALEGP